MEAYDNVRIGGGPDAGGTTRRTGQAAHSRLGGDVTLQRALETIAEADAPFAPVAQAYLRRLARPH